MCSSFELFQHMEPKLGTDPRTAEYKTTIFPVKLLWHTWEIPRPPFLTCLKLLFFNLNWGYESTFSNLQNLCFTFSFANLVFELFNFRFIFSHKKRAKVLNPSPKIILLWIFYKLGTPLCGLSVSILCFTSAIIVLKPTTILAIFSLRFNAGFKTNVFIFLSSFGFCLCFLFILITY